MVASVSSVQNGRAGIATSLPVPRHQPKAEKQALSSVSAPAPTQKRRKSQAQGSQVTRKCHNPQTLWRTPSSAQSCTKITRRIACNKLVRCAPPGHVHQQFAMADGFAPCLALTAEVVHFGHLHLRGLCCFTRTRQQEPNTWHSTKTPRLAPSLSGPKMYWPRRRRESVLSVLCWSSRLQNTGKRWRSPSQAAGGLNYQ